MFSVIFTNLTKLSGFAEEETVYLVGLMGGDINLQGLLLAGFIIGALGVLDDITVSQVSTVQEINAANPNLSRSEIYKKAMRVGVDHIASMVNTLFLAYAGAALPLLLLFSFKQEPFLTFGQVINHEIIATEIVRTLVGSIGLALAVPITTFLAAYFYKKNKTAANNINA
ncbi:MAG: YibE/F family protein [Patescibacteria group bacterium]